jgi:hypothetical protein
MMVMTIAEWWGKRAFENNGLATPQYLITTFAMDFDKASTLKCQLQN